jgi:hypothetical protein
MAGCELRTRDVSTWPGSVDTGQLSSQRDRGGWFGDEQKVSHHQKPGIDLEFSILYIAAAFGRDSIS